MPLNTGLALCVVINYAGLWLMHTEKTLLGRQAEWLGESQVIFFILGSDSATMVSCLHILAQTLDTR